jgi:hypothetical protein
MPCQTFLRWLFCVYWLSTTARSETVRMECRHSLETHIIADWGTGRSLAEIGKDTDPEGKLLEHLPMRQADSRGDLSARKCTLLLVILYFGLWELLGRAGPGGVARFSCGCSCGGRGAGSASESDPNPHAARIQHELRKTAARTKTRQSIAPPRQTFPGHGSSQKGPGQGEPQDPPTATPMEATAPSPRAQALTAAAPEKPGEDTGEDSTLLRDQAPSRWT